MEINGHLQDVLEYAKKMELDGKKRYEEEIEKTENVGLKNILKMLVEAEQNHFEIFEGIQKDIKISVLHTSFGEVKNIFQKMKESGETIVSSDDHAEFYKKVKEIEEKSEKFYRDETEKTDDDEVVQILNEVADEEHRHVILMDNLIEYASRPQQWVENAEFNHMEEY